MLQDDSLLLETAAEIGARRMFIDGLPSLTAITGNTGAEAREAFHILTESLQADGRTPILAVEPGHFGDRQTMIVPEEAIADTVIRLRMENVTRSTIRSIEIVKSRGHDFQMGRHSFRIVDGGGIAVYRRVQAPRSPARDHAAAFDATTRITTGIPGLDPLVNGGYFLGSTTVVAGVSGVGKSVMGLQYLAEGARRGERSLMLSLDEPIPQIVRNANSIGIDLRACIDRGVVRLQYDTAQEIEIDRHFHDLEATIREFRPTRVLFDSLSTYGSNLGSSGRMFRDFFHALVALMKEYQTATVYNHENPEMLGMASMMGEFAMSSLVDNIVSMNWIEMGAAFRLGLTVAKMRGNPNRRETHECESVDGAGMHVLPNPLPAEGIRRPFISYANLISRNPARQEQ